MKKYLKAHKYIFIISFNANKFLYVLNICLYALVNFIPLISLAVWSRIINNFEQNNELLIWTAIITYLIIAVISMLSNQIKSWASSIYKEKLRHCIDIEIMKKMYNVDASFIDNPDNAAMMDSIRWSSSYIYDGSTELVNTFTIALSFVSSLAVLIRHIPVLSIIFIFVCIPGSIISYIYETKLSDFDFSNMPNHREKEYYKQILTGKAYAKELRLYNLAPHFKDKYLKVVNKLRKEKSKIYLKSASLKILGLSISYLCIGVCIYFMALDVGVSMTLGTFALCVGLLSNLEERFRLLVTFVSLDNYYTVKHIVNYMDFMKSSVDIPDTGDLDVPEKISIKFSNVNFTYPGADVPALKDLSFEIEAGKTVALVGINGAGKTTIVKLLLRLYDIEEGNGDILINGLPIKSYSLESLRKTFSVCFQDINCYALSLRHNVALSSIGNAGQDDEILDALKSSHFSEMKNLDVNLTREFETDGQELSRGQWQKIAIARAFFRKANFVILDEPSSSLDAMAEADVFNFFNAICENKGGILISHRLSGVMSVDEIILIENGHIIEKGTHRQLIEKNNRYAELFAMQSERFIQGMEGAENEKQV